ncbi:hypothetical protein CKAH01_11052 [Colletotrichum kahawae]|uniref:Uncharacterized protein n=1 Tax=Colletotrichum kahawae TaxID=34407 RepID=A0AAE0CWP0_COLKA|nr:hypothetical protein CKAH01_11052 [Colletotrichum kahawae]
MYAYSIEIDSQVDSTDGTPDVGPSVTRVPGIKRANAASPDVCWKLRPPEQTLRDIDAPRGPAMNGAGHLGCGIMSLSLRALILYGSDWTNGRNGTMAEVAEYAETPLSSRSVLLRAPRADPTRMPSHDNVLLLRRTLAMRVCYGLRSHRHPWRWQRPPPKIQIHKDQTKVIDRETPNPIPWRSIMQALSSSYIGVACHPVDGASRPRTSLPVPPIEPPVVLGG